MTTFVKGSCHCGANTFKVPFKTDSLPKESWLCHCNTCRHTTGQMAYMDLAMNGQPVSIDSTEENQIFFSLNNLSGFKSSCSITRYFCKTCSAHVFESRTKEPEGDWAVVPGTLEKVDGIVTFTSHIFVGDTLDGGIADHLRRVGDKTLPRHRTLSDETGSGEISVGWKDPTTTNVTETPKLPFYCACKAIQFYLTRPTKLIDDPEVYWLVPGFTPEDPIRFNSAHCLCNSCRLTGGNLIQSWAVVSSEHLFDAATDAPLDLADPNKRPKGLKQYEATPGKHRESCETCGATVFWWREMKDGEHPHTDVAVALVDQVVAGGARAEAWLAWYPSVIHKDFSLSSEIAKGLVDAVEGSSK
ncbi:Mss4-like protein [Coprinopsis sp. MPI-PUGE-AT-0042]|nr:Mss4-like protein [Coprinopsis sp. MPI-PUGE-AT-0042]